MRIQIVRTELPRCDCGPGGNFPGYTNIHVGVQRKNRRDDLLDLHPGDASTAVWTLDYSVSGTDVRGPYVQGPPGGRFIYLNWGRRRRRWSLHDVSAREAMLEDVPTEVLEAAAARPVDQYACRLRPGLVEGWVTTAATAPSTSYRIT